MSTATAAETPQHMIALSKANKARRGHATLKAELKVGALSVVEAMEDPRARGRLTIAQLLGAQRLWGESRTRKLLRSVAVNPERRVDALTERQRRVIVEALA